MRLSSRVSSHATYEGPSPVAATITLIRETVPMLNCARIIAYEALSDRPATCHRRHRDTHRRDILDAENEIYDDKSSGY